MSLHDTWSPWLYLLLIHSSKCSSSFVLSGFLPPPVNFFLCFPLEVATKVSISLFLDLYSRILFSSTRNSRDAGRLPCISAYLMASLLSSRLYVWSFFLLCDVVFIQIFHFTGDEILCCCSSYSTFFPGNHDQSHYLQINCTVKIDKDQTA